MGGDCRQVLCYVNHWLRARHHVGLTIDVVPTLSAAPLRHFARTSSCTVPSRRGVTLIEMLVAATVISIMMLIAIPSFRHVLDKAEESTSPGSVIAVQLEARRLTVTNSYRFPADVVDQMKVAGLTVFAAPSTGRDEVSALRVDEFTLILASLQSASRCLILVDSTATDPVPPATTVTRSGWALDTDVSARGCRAEGVVAQVGAVTTAQRDVSDPLLLTLPTPPPTTTTTTTAPPQIGGSVVWAARFGGAGSDEAHAAAVGADGTVYVTGSFSGTVSFGATSLTSTGATDAFVVALDGATGAPLWAQRTGAAGTSADHGRGIAVTAEAVFVSGYYQTGALTGFAAGAATSAANNDAFVAALDPGTGAPLWARASGGPGDDRGLELAATSNGVYVSGYYGPGTITGFAAATGPSAGSTDAFVAALNPLSGATLWATRAGTAGSDFGRGITASGSSLFVTGYYAEGPVTGFLAEVGVSAGGTDVFLAHLDPATGAPVWVSRTGTPSNDAGIAVATNGSLVFVAGDYAPGTITGFASTLPASAGGSDAFVSGLSASLGGPQWSTRTGGTSGDFARGLSAGSNALFASGHYGPGTITGFAAAAGESAGVNDAYVAALSLANGIPLWVERSGTTSEDYSLGVTSSPSGAYVTGYFGAGTLSGYGTGAGSSAGSSDILVAKLAP